MPETNACQLVLKYLLMNKTLFSKAYHDRLYYFSSGSKFMVIAGKLQDWMIEQDKTIEEYAKDPNPDVPMPKNPKH